MKATRLYPSISPDLLPLPEAGDVSRPLTPAEQRLKDLILEGMASGDAGEMDKAYFDSLRERVRTRSLIS